MTTYKPIYFDYAATTPVDERVAEKMCQFLTSQGDFGNPSSLHVYGMLARDAIEAARENVAQFLHAEHEEIIWTSGATEANNLAIKGVAQLYQRKGKHIVTLKTEHKAVLDPCQSLEKKGYPVTYLSPLANGRLDLQVFEAALRPDTILVSVMAVNNEIGVIQDLASIANITAQRGILLHVDAAQAPGKIELNLKKIPIDLLSLCAHKVYGPKGIGALFLRKKPRVRVEPLLHGGGHEQGMRSGTLATHQIVGMGEAFLIARQEFKQDYAHIFALRQRLLRTINSIPKIRLNIPIDFSVPHILSLRFENMIADAVLKALPMIASSTASACQGKGTEGSYVLRALGFSEQEAKASVRLSFGRMTKDEEVDVLASQLEKLFR